MPNPAVAVPYFPRLDEYAGLWACEPTRFAALWSSVGRIDLSAHVAAAPPPLVSAVEKVPGRGGSSVAVVKAAGTLMKQQSSLGGTSTIQLRRDIRTAAADPDVGAILLAVDSPGGTVAGTADLAAEVRAARRQKPVWAHVDDLGASAAYWFASQAEKVFANAPTALVGSIGTLMLVEDSSGAAEKGGVKVLRFATGPLKGAGSDGLAVSEEVAAYFQSLVDATQAHFDADVRKARGLTDRQLAAVRTGGVFTAAEAQDRKLIDGVRPLARTLDELAGEAARRGSGGGTRAATAAGGVR